MEKSGEESAGLRAVPAKAGRLIGCCVLLLLALMLVSIATTSTPVSGMSLDDVSSLVLCGHVHLLQCFVLGFFSFFTK